MKYTAHIGIDPGKLGAVTVLGDGKLLPLIEHHKMPLLVNDDYNVEGLLNLLVHIATTATTEAGSPLVLLEDVHSLHNVSAKSNFVLGYGVGLIRSCVIAAGLPFILIGAKKWQKACFEGVRTIERGGPVIEGRGLVDTKKMAAIAAQRLYPKLTLNFGGRARVPHSGLVDSLLIAHYGQMVYK